MKIHKNHKISFLVVFFLILLVMAINNAPSYAAGATNVCGNKKIETPEACDDGNLNNFTDGCSKTCTIDTGWTCRAVANPLGGTYSICTKDPVCPNGIKETGETCDDGNMTNFDGCSRLCSIESGWGCTGTPSVCTELCSNGIVNSGETCDDGNITSNDGCSFNCNTETGYICTGNPSSCNTVCGDGITADGSDEECDDGNTDPFDGCDNCKERLFLGPSAAPPGGDVTPTFTGLVVDGDLTIAGSINQTSATIFGPGGSIPAPINSIINGSGDIYTAGLFYSSGIFTDNGLTFYGNAPTISSVMSDTIKIQDNLDLQGTISDSNSNLIINDTVELSGGLTVNGITNLQSLSTTEFSTGSVSSYGDINTSAISNGQIGSFYSAKGTNVAGNNFASSQCDEWDRVVGCSGFVTSGDHFRGSKPYYINIDPFNHFDYCAAYSSGYEPAGFITAVAICFDPQGLTNQVEK